MPKKIFQKNIGFLEHQIKFIDLNPDFNLNQFCRIKLEEYMKKREEVKEQ